MQRMPGCLSPLNADILFVFIWGNEQAGQGDNRACGKRIRGQVRPAAFFEMPLEVLPVLRAAEGTFATTDSMDCHWPRVLVTSLEAVTKYTTKAICRRKDLFWLPDLR